MTYQELKALQERLNDLLEDYYHEDGWWVTIELSFNDVVVERHWPSDDQHDVPDVLRAHACKDLGRFVEAAEARPERFVLWASGAI